MGLLAEILAAKRDEVVELRHAVSGHSRPAEWAVRDVANALARPPGSPLRLIAEVKFRSPSAGQLSRALGASARAQAYARGGATLVSVLTDARWFDGSFDDLAACRSTVDVPLLCKDYVIDAVQIERAWTEGADAVLLIVRCLPDGLLQELVTAVRERGLTPFVEVTDEGELDRALVAGATVIGVNARDLDTLAMDAARATRVLSRIPADRVAVHLSGLRAPEDARRIATSRADAALIGEALMRQEQPEDLLRAMAEAAG